MRVRRAYVCALLMLKFIDPRAPGGLYGRGRGSESEETMTRKMRIMVEVVYVVEYVMIQDKFEANNMWQSRWSRR